MRLAAVRGEPDERVLTGHQDIVGIYGLLGHVFSPGASTTSFLQKAIIPGGERVV
jgi:hypothetical protein